MITSIAYDGILLYRLLCEQQIEEKLNSSNKLKNFSFKSKITKNVYRTLYFHE
jgi:hypothetical protein